MKDEDSRLLNSDFGGSGIQGGLAVTQLHGFDVYVSNNLPSVGTGPATTGSANQNSNFGVIVGGHSSAIASASQITKTESYRDPDSFADIVRGMHLYGRNGQANDVVTGADSTFTQFITTTDTIDVKLIAGSADVTSGKLRVYACVVDVNGAQELATEVARDNA